MRAMTARTTKAAHTLNTINANVPVAMSKPAIKRLEPNIVNSRDDAPLCNHYAAASGLRPPRRGTVVFLEPDDALAISLRTGGINHVRAISTSPWRR